MKKTSKHIYEMRRDVFTNTFNLSFLERENHPTLLTNFIPVNFPTDCRVLHYLVKTRKSNKQHLGKIDWLTDYINTSLTYAETIGINTFERYVYITVDQGYVEPGDTLRTPGWHIDGLQGDEVHIKKPGDFQTIWSDALPTEYVTHPFNIEGMDISKHNIFNRLADQVNENTVVQMKENYIYAMSSYLVHRAAETKKHVYRRFIRVSISHIPVTSINANINAQIEYDYNTGTTTGEIPTYLK